MTDADTSAVPDAGSRHFAAVSVIVPAHDEAVLIERCLLSLRLGARVRELQLVVVCNGCSDDTAAIARRVAPQAVVIETPVSAKHAALTLGDAAALHFPRCYVDADVVVSPGALDAVAAALEEPGVHAAAPEPAFDLSKCGPGARLFLGIWEHSPYFTQDLVGSGFYAMSAAGRGRFGAFPPVVADDDFVLSLFPPQERRSVAGSSFTPLLPPTLRGLLHIHIRHLAARRELEQWLSTSGEHRAIQLRAPSSRSWLVPLLRDPRRWPAIAVYVAVKALSAAGGAWKCRFGSMAAWNRDDAGRRAASGAAR